MRNLYSTLLAVSVLSLAGCSAPRADVVSHAVAPHVPQPSIRIARPDTNTVQLQTALRKFIPASGRGPAIWLSGTAHIGEPAYYATLQRHLDAQTVVLFEGIDAGAHPRRVPKPGEPLPPPFAPARPAPRAANDPSSMQSTLAHSLGLVFQLDAINYQRPNFLNSDLSVLQLQRLMLDDPTAVPAAPGEAGASPNSFDNLVSIMDGTSFLGSLFKVGLQIIGSSSSLQAITRLTFIETLGGIKGDFSEVRGVPPDVQHLLKVLIQARNQNLIEDLKTELKLVPKNGSISVFYGNGHMDDFERRLVADLHYQPVGDYWLTAFSVDVRQTGLNPAQLQSLHDLIQRQLDQLQK